MILRRLLGGVSAVLLIAMTAQAQWFERQFNVMGTVARVEVSDHDADHAKTVMDAVQAEMQRIDSTMSPYVKTSELSRINRDAYVAPVMISKELFDLINTSIDFSERSNGAFDITFSSVGFYYDYRHGIKPDAQTIATNLPNINYHHLRMDPSVHSIRFQTSGTRIDLGGIAKGYAIDRCVAIIKAAGIRSAFVNAGGDSFVIGSREGRPWFIAIKHPRDKNKELLSLPLADTAVSTSGDYERYFDDKEGKRYHHILNPKTGDSARESQSVTILANDSTTADALSTTVFILGAERGLALINGMQNVSAVIVDKNGKVHYSDDLVMASKKQ